MMRIAALIFLMTLANCAAVPTCPDGSSRDGGIGGTGIGSTGGCVQTPLN